MISTDLDSLTGLPIINETRTGGLLFRALPRDIGKVAITLQGQNEDMPWLPQHHEYAGNVLQRVRCWKCGADIKGWRLMLDQGGMPVVIAGRQAMAFLPLPNGVSTPFAIRLKKLNRSVVFNVQHCHDCDIADQDGMEVLACMLGGMDSILQNAMKFNLSKTHPDQWATWLYRWSGSEPIGVIHREDIMQYERIPAPGELITSSDFAMYVDAAQRNRIPSGALIMFSGDNIPEGWKESTKKGYIEKI